MALRLLFQRSEAEELLLHAEEQGGGRGTVCGGEDHEAPDENGEESFAFPVDPTHFLKT